MENEDHIESLTTVAEARIIMELKRIADCLEIMVKDVTLDFEEGEDIDAT